jgi:hypothetical protein
MASSILAAATGGLRWSQILYCSNGRRRGSVRDEDTRGSSSGLPDGLLNAGEDGQTKVLRASLLGVCSTNNLCAWGSCQCGSVKISAMCLYGRIPYSMACCAWKLDAGSAWGISLSVTSVRLRSLLAGEALEEDLCVAVDAQVLDGLGVLGRAGRVLPGRGLGERRAQGLSEGLHDEWQI